MRYLESGRRVGALQKVLAARDSWADGSTTMILSRTSSLSRIAVAALAITVALPMAGAQAQWHGGGGGWHGGGGWGWRGGGGWGWGGPSFLFTVPPFYYAPPPY